MSLERGVCSLAELQVFSCYRGWKEAFRTRARFQQHRDASCHQVFFFLQGKAQKENHVILKETLGEHPPSYPTVKNWVAQFKRGEFSICDAPRPGRPKTVTTPEISDQIHELLLEDRRISAKSISWATGHLTWAGWVHHSWRFGYAESLREVGPKCLNADQER